jgi:hypothetical protein
MTALLVRAAQAVSVRARPTGGPLIDSCAPDCTYQYVCDSNHRLFRRECCYRSDCTWYCDEWVQTASNC